MTQRDVAARAGWLVDQRRVQCDCGRVGRHAADCKLEAAWTRALRQAESQLRREEQARHLSFARAV